MNKNIRLNRDNVPLIQIFLN